MSYFDIIDDDLIVKILDIRCNDIENIVATLENNMLNLLFELGFLTIEQKTIDTLDKYEYSYIYHQNHKYNIIYGGFIYWSDIYLFKIIFYGKVTFVSILYEDYINDQDNYEVVESYIYINPTMFQLLAFTAICNDFESYHNYIEGFNVLSKKAIKSYKIVPQYGITYIEMITVW